MFNLDTLALKDTVELQLKHPVTDELLFADGDKAEKPVVIVLYGTSSKQYRNAITAMQSRALRRGKKAPTVEEMREESVRLLVACSERAVNLSYKGGAIETAETFRELYSDPAFSWLKDQVDAGLGDVSNFLEA
jgi:hypothetical protein